METSNPYRTAALLPAEPKRAARYRIVSVGRSGTTHEEERFVYFLQRRRRFIFWSWWALMNDGVGFYDIEDAESALKRLTREPKFNVVKEFE